MKQLMPVKIRTNRPKRKKISHKFDIIHMVGNTEYVKYNENTIIFRPLNIVRNEIFEEIFIVQCLHCNGNHTVVLFSNCSTWCSYNLITDKMVKSTNDQQNY